MEEKRSFAVRLLPYKMWKFDRRMRGKIEAGAEWRAGGDDADAKKKTSKRKERREKEREVEQQPAVFVEFRFSSFPLASRSSVIPGERPSAAS